tara:strand:+ start:296 stop:562 length:267 start_codon:yes stop_codon:yes gene_type:complete
MNLPTLTALNSQYEFDFQFVDISDMWLRTDVTVFEALECIKSGLLRNRAVSKIKLFAINIDGDEGSASFVYDVIAAKQGNNPWSILQF